MRPALRRRDRRSSPRRASSGGRHGTFQQPLGHPGDLEVILRKEGHSLIKVEDAVVAS